MPLEVDSRPIYRLELKKGNRLNEAEILAQDIRQPGRLDRLNPALLASADNRPGDSFPGILDSLRNANLGYRSAGHPRKGNCLKDSLRNLEIQPDRGILMKNAGPESLNSGLDNWLPDSLTPGIRLIGRYGLNPDSQRMSSLLSP